jgi:hypothetical protein
MQKFISTGKILAIFLSLSLVFVSCSPLQQLQALAKCQFRLNTIENLQFAGINIQGKESVSNLGILDAGKIASVFLLKQDMPLNFRLNMDVKNPNANPAALSRLDWILMIDDTEMVSGVTNEKLNVAANGGVATLPLDFNINLKEAFAGKSKDSILNLIFALSGKNNRPSRITLKAKPYIQIGTASIPYPGYINIKKDFTSGI